MRHIIKYGMIGLLILLLLSENRMMIIPFLFLIIAVSIPLQISYALKIKKWEKRLQQRHVSRDEYEDVVGDLKSIWWVPNHPKYWGRCKTIYFAALHSRELSLEQKRQLFDVLDALKLKGIPYPKERPSINRETTSHDLF